MLTNTTVTKNTEYGYGWSLNLSKIERSARFGTPDYINPAQKVLDPATAEEVRGHRFEIDGELLVRDPTDNLRFHKRFNDGSRILYLDDGGGKGSWEVTKPDGTKFLYGSRDTAKSELARSQVSTGTEVFRWSLDEVIDPRGNAYRIDYEEDTHVLPLAGSGTGTFQLYIYPKTITYSYFHDPGGGQVVSTHALRRVEFTWHSRGDPGDPSYDPGSAGLDHRSADRPTSYRSGFKVQQRKRLADVRIAHGGSGHGTGTQIRRYQLEYGTKGEGSGFVRSNSELVTIQRYGMLDEVFPSEEDPSATVFTYTGTPGQFQSPVDYFDKTGAIRVTHSHF